MALMARRRKFLLSIAAVVVIVLMAAGWRLLPVFTGPALPAGATRLHIATERPNATAGCPAALLVPARVTTAGDDLVLVAVDTGETVPVVWPAGFTAWRMEGRAVVADPWGSVVGREGAVLDSLGGGFGPDDVFRICQFGFVTEP